MLMLHKRSPLDERESAIPEPPQESPRRPAENDMLGFSLTLKSSRDPPPPIQTTYSESIS